MQKMCIFLESVAVTVAASVTYYSALSLSSTAVAALQQVSCLSSATQTVGDPIVSVSLVLGELSDRLRTGRWRSSQPPSRMPRLQ